MGKRPNFYIIIGAPGSGKGTQSQKLAKKCGIPHISSGDILREAVQKKTPLGLEVESLVSQGAFVSDNLIWELVREKLSQPTCLNGCILDGFPRTVNQAILLDGFLISKFPNYLAILLEISEEEVLHRICSRFVCPSCNRVYSEAQGLSYCPQCNVKLVRRSDDHPEVVRERLKIYKLSTEPVIDYYDQHHKLCKVASSGPVDEVFQKILDCIKM
ncbi:adenylate kinase family protein [Chlamydia ibidis]|uniref:Adenylate kinase n=2 Tax=Chlamydia ibidis TaxID=1405396 RepID=S7J4Y6_9CHLA|nr:adenylate kinase [Chlamydia ibidis]EPP35112.1 adenylate kinase family protein [Chlamydia ibidis]EQM62664.1 adenylate kinase family protein [Chlamydia ibidis 10-1398/6]